MLDWAPADQRHRHHLHVLILDAMTTDSSLGRWHSVPGLLALVLVCAGAVGMEATSPDASSLRSAEQTPLAPADTQHIVLEEGWNLISSRLVPDDPSMEAVFAPIADAVEVVRGPSGAVYKPGDGTNTIGDWEVRAGYEVYVTSPQTLVIEGSPPVPSESAISLEEGWNTVSYLPSTTQSPTEALASIDGSIGMVKNGTGDAFIPGEGITRLEALAPGEGYKVYATANTDLEYPLDEATLFTYDPQCESQPDAHLVHNFGSLTEGRQVEDSLAIRENTAAINTALSEVGQEGGGTVCLPKGIYQVRPHPDLLFDPDATNQDYPSIIVDHSNLTLWGAGRNDDGNGTGIYSNGDTTDVAGSLRRGTGLRIGHPNSSHTPTRENIVLRDFELNGQGALPGDSTAWTGCKDWRSREGRINCWDITHKGINVSNGHYVDNVRIENVAVRSFKGELLYQGGNRLGFIELENIISEDTNAQGVNIVADSLRIEDSYIGLSNQWYELESRWESSAYITGTTHDKVAAGFSVVFAQGDGSTVDYVFENNHFTGCNFQRDKSGQAFAFAEGVAGPIRVKNNTFDDCGLFTTITGGTSGITPRNLIFEQNTVENLTSAPSFKPTMTIDFEVRNNTLGAVWSFGWATYTGRIEDNTFSGGGIIGMGGGGPSMRPLVQNNTYLDLFDENGDWAAWDCDRVSEGTQEDQTIRPNREVCGVRSPGEDTAQIELYITTGEYADGQPLTIQNMKVDPQDFVFTTNNPTYNVSKETVISNGEEMSFVYNAESNIWEEMN